MTATETTDPRPAPVERLAYNARETAQALGISLVTLWRLEKRGLLKPSRALRIPLWSRTEIERFLEATK
jgi:predicted site-specific integrase-resolvase